MRFKRAMAASMAAVMAVSSAVVCQVTASAADSQTLVTNQAVTGTFNADGNIQIDALNNWGSGLNADDYASVIMEYEIEEVGNASAIKVAVNGNECGWVDAGEYTLSVGTKTLELDMSNENLAGKKFEWIGYQVAGTANEESTAKITIKSLILKSKLNYGEETVIYNNPAAETNKTVSIGASGCDVTFDFAKYSKEALLDITVVTDATAAAGDGLGQIVLNGDWSHTQTIGGAVVNQTKVYTYPIGDIMEKASVDSTADISTVHVQSYKEYAKITKIAIRDVEQSDVAVSSLTIEGEADRTATYGDSDVTLTAKANADATDFDETKVTWSSSNEDVATVSADGKVTFVGAGSATIKAIYDDNDTISDSVKFTVAKKEVPVTITAGIIDGATSVTDAEERAKTTVQVKADGLTASDYTVTVKVDGKNYTATVALTDEAAKKYELTGDTTVKGTISYKVTNLKLSASKLSVNVTSTAGAQLTVTAVPDLADFAADDIKWTSSDEKIAKVSSDGLVTPVAVGNAKITAALKSDDTISASCDVTVFDELNPAVKVELDKAELSGTVGEKADLKAAVTAKDTTKDCTDNIVWASSNEKVAVVVDGTVTFVGEGTAEITATAGDASAVCKVTVKAATVAVDKVTLDKTSAELTVGDTATIKATVTPDNATDKTVTWTSSDETVATVKDGVVTAVKAGKADITAKAGDKTATCAVTVKAKETDKPASDVFSGKADIKPTDLKTWNDNVQIGKTKVEEKSVVRIKYSIIDGDQHQIKVQDGDKWEVLTSIKTNEWGVTEVSKDGILEITLNSADAAAIANGGLAITGVGIRVESVDFNVVVDSTKYGNGSETKTEFVKTTVNADSTLNMLAVFSISEENAKNFEKYVVVIKRASDNKSIVEHVDTYYDTFDYTVDGVMHEGSSENGKHLIVLNLVNADPSWGAITVIISPEGEKG